MLKQAFWRGKELQKEVVPLYNIFSNRLDDFVDSSDDKDVINRRQRRNATSPRLPTTGRNGAADHFGMEEGAAGRNRIAGHSRIEPRIEGANGDSSDVSFSIEE